MQFGFLCEELPCFVKLGHNYGGGLNAAFWEQNLAYWQLM
jgi:hypothetical protein